MHTRLTAVIAEPIPLGTGEVFVTASVGIALASGVHATSPADLLRDADTAMYRAKEGGRAQACVFRAVNGRDALTHLRTATELHRALGEARWVAAYLTPWMLRRLMGRSSGDGIKPKRPALHPVDR